MSEIKNEGNCACFRSWFKCTFGKPDDQCAKCLKSGSECGPKTLTLKRQASVKPRQLIPGQRIYELDEKGSSASTPLSVISPKESTKNHMEPTENTQRQLDTYIKQNDARMRCLEERVAKLDGGECGTGPELTSVTVGGSKPCTKTMENAVSRSTSLAPQNMVSRDSLESGRESAVAPVSPLNWSGYSSSSRAAVYEPPATNYQLAGQFHNVSSERAMDANNGVNWGATGTPLENMLCRSCRHDRSGIRIFSFADPSGTVTLSLPNCQLPQQWYYPHRWFNGSSSIVLYYLLYNVRHVGLHANPLSPRFSAGDHVQGRPHSPSPPFYIDGELRRYHLDSMYCQDSNGDIVTPPHHSSSLYR